MLRVALTGGIATGKSYVLARLRERGIPTIDADDLVHAALEPGTPTSQAIAARFGADVMKADGSPDRARLARTVFADPAARAALESLLHPGVYGAIDAWFAAIDQPVGVASIPLLYETGHESDFDYVIATTCTPDQQLQRVVQRGLSKEDATARIAAQMPAAEKAQRADFVIDTSGTFEKTERQVDEAIESLIPNP